jgi:ribosomal protein S18 acetylase RimI-like enzyme
VRPFEARDRDAVRDVCWETASVGGNAPIYSDRASWVDMYTSYYTDHEPESSFVVVSEADRVLGYLLGCANTRLAHSQFRIGLRHNLIRFLWARPSTARFWWRAGWDAVTGFRGPSKPAVDLTRYPAHMHCNLLPEARFQGVAVELFTAFHGYLRSRGVSGAHGEALASNHAVHALLRKLGYTKLGEPFWVPGVRTPEGARQFGQLVICDFTQPKLSSRVPGR